MVVEAIFNVLFAPLELILTLLPDISWNMSSDGFTTFANIIKSLLYLLPLGTISMLVGLVVTFIIFRSVISLVKTIWQLLPLL